MNIDKIGWVLFNPNSIIPKDKATQDGTYYSKGRIHKDKIPNAGKYNEDVGKLNRLLVCVIVTFSDIEAEVAKFDLAVKYVKINSGLSFEQTIMSLSL